MNSTTRGGSFLYHPTAPPVRATKRGTVDPEKDFYHFLPENMDLSAFPKLSPYLEIAKWMISRLMLGHYFQRKSRAEFVNLHSDTLREFMGPKDCAKVIRILISYGLIESNHTYRRQTLEKHGFATGYRLTKRWWNDGIEKQIILKKTIVKKIIQKITGKTEAGEEILEQWASKVKIHEKKATKAVKKRTDGLRKEIENSNDAAEISEFQSKIEKRERFAARAIAKISEGRGRFIIGRTGRAHTSVTSLPKEARACLYFKGHAKLVSVDLSNAQVLFLYTGCVGSLEIKCDTKLHCRKNDVPVEAMTFADLVCSGSFYRFIGSKLGRRKKKKLTKDQIKRRFFIWAFQRRDRYSRRQSKMDRLMEKFFPQIWNYVADLRRRGISVAAMLQREESDFFIRRMPVRLNAELPEMPILTVHDCLMVPENYADRVHAILMDEFAKIGLAPHFSIK